MSMRLLGLGAGEGGGRMAMALARLGVNVGVINTNKGDLDGLKIITEDKKLLVNISSGGSGKDPNFVKESLKNPELKKQIIEFINKLLVSTPIFTNCPVCQSKEQVLDIEAIGDQHTCKSCNQDFGIKEIFHEPEVKHDYLFIFACLGGGSGSGLIEEIIDLCQIYLNIPIAVICTLPDDSEDTISKTNAVAIFKQLYNKYALKGVVSPFILVDNQKMQEIFDLPIGAMYESINNMIATTVDTFNSFSNKTSKYMTTIDAMDTAHLWSMGGCCTMGKFTVGNLQNKKNKNEITVESFVDFEAIDSALEQCVFVDGFDLSTAQGVGVIAVAPEHFMQGEYPSKCIRYVFGKIKELTGANTIFRGQYENPNLDCLEFYVFYNGLKYPEKRIARLWQEIKEGKASIERKKQRIDGVNIEVDLESISHGGSNFQKIQAALHEPTKLHQPEVSKQIRFNSCPNCYPDPITKKSMGVYRKGGPSPFSGRICPICKGTSRVPSKD